MAGTVLLISAAYSRIIEEFPSGGGGYVVASKLLGPRIGVVSGCALLVDYVLTITTSIAAAGDSLFSFLPAHWLGAKLATEVVLLVMLTAINIRGVRESVLALLPVFLLFVVTHALLIGLGIAGHIPQLASTTAQVGTDVHRGISALGATGLVLLMLRAYSLGGGTYTGIEAVSNGLPIMREPRVKTGRRTMAYMASSLAFTASGLLLCYLLWHIVPVPGKTMNAVLAETVLKGLPFSGATGRRDAVRGGGTAGGGSAGRIPRWSARALEHGDRQLGAAPLCVALRTPDHAERHHADGRGRAAGALVYEG